jgi:hypothetical protein
LRRVPQRSPVLLGKLHTLLPFRFKHVKECLRLKKRRLVCGGKSSSRFEGGTCSKEENVADRIMSSMAWLPTSRRTFAGSTPIMFCRIADDVKASAIASMRRPITRARGMTLAWMHTTFLMASSFGSTSK